MVIPKPRWNVNLHALARLLDAIPEGARAAVDVGCGEGETTRRLRARVDSVVGVDLHLQSLETARSGGEGIPYVTADVLALPFPDATFDVVTAVAVLHHVDLGRALSSLRSLVRPGGLLLVVGLARSRALTDYARDVVDAIAVRRHTLTKGVWETPAPKVWPPPLAYREARAVSLECLPGARFSRVAYFRYAVTWVRPAS